MPNERLHFLDTLRVLALALLVIFHVGMYYGSWEWHIKSPSAGPALDPWMQLSSPWRMSLLFLVSGAATGWLLGAAGATLRQRLARLLKPLLPGVVLVVPPQSWLEVVHQLGYTGGYLDFLRLYFSGHGGFCAKPGQCLILPTWNHLWFLPYVALYTALAWGVLRHGPGAGAVLRTAARRLAASGGLLLLLPIAWLLATRLVLLPRFAPSHALVDDLYLHAQYAPLFLLGLAWARDRASWIALARWRHLALVAGLLSWTMAVADPAALPITLHRALASIQQWAGVVAATGYAVVHLDRPWPWVRRWGERVFPLYLVHQTVIMLAAQALAPWALNPWFEAPLLLAITGAAGLAFYRLVRPLAWLHPWCGLAPRQPGDHAAASRAEAVSIEARRLS